MTTATVWFITHKVCHVNSMEKITNNSMFKIIFFLFNYSLLLRSNKNANFYSNNNFKHYCFTRNSSIFNRTIKICLFELAFLNFALSFVDDKKRVKELTSVFDECE